MKNLIKILSVVILFLSIAQPVVAENVAGKSAVMLKNLTTNNNKRSTQKRMVISKILSKYNSPLVDSTDAFVTTCLKYELDCYLLPSIAGLESTFGNSVLPNSNNPFGWGGGYIVFNSWEESIKEVGQGLKENYIDKGANTVEKIAPIYAESLTWAPRVNYYIDIFENEENKIDSILNENEVKL